MIPDDPRCSNIEDLRIFDYQDRVWFIGFIRRGDNDVFESYIGVFDEACERIEEIKGVIRKEGVHVKNITPLIRGDTLWFVDIYTGCVYFPDGSFSHMLDLSQIHERMREYKNAVYGTTQYVHLHDNMYGGLVHITKRIGGRLFYMYMWTEIDVATWKVTFMSAPFMVYTLGLVFVSHIEKISSNTFQIMFGHNDRKTYRGVVTLDALRGVTNQSSA